MILARDKHIVLWLSSVATLIVIMIVVGGLTRLTESGLSMVDWKIIGGLLPPLSNASWIELFENYKLYPEFKIKNSNMDLNEFKYIFWWEYGHRVLGRLIGIVFLVPFVYFVFKKYFSKKELVVFFLLFFLGLSQGLIGWWMVKSGLVENPYVDHLRLAIHLFMAQSILVIISFIILKKLYPSAYKFTSNRRNLKYQFLILLLVTIVTIWYGAFMAGLDAGKSFNSWPLMGGQVIPENLFLDNFYENILHNSVFIHFTHRMLAYLLFFYFIYLFILSKKLINSYFEKFHINLILVLVIIQIALGILTVIYNVPILFGSLHQLNGTLLLVAIATFVFSHLQKT